MPVEDYLVFLYIQTDKLRDTSETAEILEVIAIPIDCRSMAVQPSRQFHAYVKPTREFAISKNIADATEIREFYIEQADHWASVVKRLDDWYRTWPNASLIVDETDKYRKLRRIMQPKPEIPASWYNFTKEFKDCFGESAADMHIERMAGVVGIPVEGRKTNSRDFSFNLALMTVEMLKKGHQFGNKDSD